MGDEKLKIPKTAVIPEVKPKVTSTFVAGTGIATYTFPAQEVPNTKKPKLVTFYNRLTKEMVTVDQNASANTKLEQAYGVGAAAQGGLSVAENIVKGITVKNPKGMGLVILARIAVGTLKYNQGTSQYSVPKALITATLTNIKFTTLGYFGGLKVPPKIQKKFDEVVHLSHELHHYFGGRTYSPTKTKFKLPGKGKIEGEFNYLDLQFGLNRIEAKYLNAKTGVSVISSGIDGVKTMFGPGQPNGTFGNSASETHPQNSIGSETHKNAKEASAPTNIVKVVNTAEIEVPIELGKRKIRGGKLTSNEKLLIDVRNKRKWIIANAITEGKELVEIAPKVYLNLSKYDAPSEVTQAVHIVLQRKIKSMVAKGLLKDEKPKAMYGSPSAALGLGGKATLIAAAAEQIYEVGKQFYAIGEVWYKSNFGLSDDERKQQALAQQRIDLIAAGGKEVKNPDGSVTITFDIKKQKQAVDNVINKGQNLQLKFQLEKQTKEFKAAAERNKLINFAKQQQQREISTFSQINNGLGVNTQRGPQTGTFGQNMGWTTNK
jgi:hypothetical protein